MPCIPPELFRFRCQKRRVEWIDARCSKIEDFPLREIEKCRATLRELNLSSNAIEFVPDELYHFDKLEILDLGCNFIRQLPEGISQLALLEELILNGNFLQRLPEDLASCAHLFHLSLSANELPYLPPVICQLESLTTLNIASMELMELPDDFARLRNLQSLDIRDNQLAGFPLVLCHLPNLATLDIGSNEISCIPNEIGLLVNLRELSIDENAIEALPDDLVAGCSKLEVLEISRNRIRNLPDTLGDLQSLQELRCSRNRLSAFPNSIGRLKALRALHAQENAMDEALNPAISGCSALEELDLSDNFLSELPSSIGNLENLRSLNLASNELIELPTTVGGCRALRVLSLRQNNLREIPMDVGRLTNLKVLDVCFNRLSHLPFTLNVILPTLEALWVTVSHGRPIPALAPFDDPKTGVRVLTSDLFPQNKTTNQAALATPNKVSTPSKVKFVDSPDPTSKRSPFVRNSTSALRQGTPLPIKSLLSRLSLHETTPSESGIASTSTESEAFFGAQSQRLVCELERNGGDGEWGFSFIGGSDERSPIRVVNVVMGGCAHSAGLRIGDRIVAVNGVDFSSQIQHHEAIEFFVNASAPMEIVVERLESPASTLNSKESTFDQQSNTTTQDSISDPVARSLSELDDIPMIDSEEDDGFSSSDVPLAAPTLCPKITAILA